MTNAPPSPAFTHSAPAASCRRFLRTIEFARRAVLLPLANLALVAAPAPSDSSSPPVVLPRMTITSERLEPGWLIPKSDRTNPTFKGVPPVLLFPHQARFKGITDGRAVIGIMLDAEGHPTDFLPIRYTQVYFADELIQAVRNEPFTSRRVKGVAVPGPFYVGQRFYPTALKLNPMEAWAEAIDRVANSLRDGPPFIFEPHLEHELDGHALQFTAVEVPALPAGFVVPPAESLKVVVSFYVDETGAVRLPNVESATAPQLTATVLAAVARWKFGPPTCRGKPALVFAVRSIALANAPASPHGQ